MPIITDISTTWTAIKWKFRVEGSRMIRTIWEDNESWTKIYSKREWKEMMEPACEKPALEDNGGLPCCLTVAVPKKKYC